MLLKKKPFIVISAFKTHYTIPAHTTFFLKMDPQV